GSVAMRLRGDGSDSDARLMAWGGVLETDAALAVGRAPQDRKVAAHTLHVVGQGAIHRPRGHGQTPTASRGTEPAGSRSATRPLRCNLSPGCATLSIISAAKA